MSLPISNFTLIFSVPVTIAFAWWIWSKFFVSRPFDNVRGPSSASSLKGNRAQIWHPTDGIKFMQDITQQYGGVVRLEGVFGMQELFISDPLALNSISINDTTIWQMPAEVLATNVVLFGKGLPGTTGEVHRKHRKELNPVFSKAHIRDLTPVFYSVGKQLRDAILAIVKEGPEEIDVLPWTARVSLELIGQGGLGYSFDKLTEDKPDEYASAVKDLLPLVFQNPVARALAPFFPLPLRRFLARTAPFKSLQALARIIRVLELSSKKVLHSKRMAVENGEMGEQIGGGKDLMSALLRAHLQRKGADPMPESHLLGHINALIFGAVETTSSALTRVLHILAQYPDVQNQIRKESDTMCERFATEELSFDTLSEMPYIDAFLREIFRLYAPVPMILRCAVKDTVLPLYNPIIGKNGREIKEIAVPAGTTVFASLLIPNISTDIWGEDALQFKPERWLSPLPSTVANARLPGVYSHLMSFWGGRSACLFQFSQLELKIVISLVLRSFRFSLSDKEVAWRASGLQFPRLLDTDSMGLPLIVEAL